jgi:hypothetical protein
MKMNMFAAVAAVALAGFATAASAAEVITITAVQGPDILPTGETLITNFDSTGGTQTESYNGSVNVPSPFLQGGVITYVNPGYTFTQDNASAYTRDGAAGLDSGVSAPPPGDTSYYESVESGGSATLTSLAGMTQFSFYMGSPDTYNNVSLTIIGQSGTTVLAGDHIWCQNPDDPASTCYKGGGDQSLGFVVTYTFAPDAVKSIQFTSLGSNAFEFDTLGAISVPEPASWALMIAGFGLAGASLRAKRRQALTA